ncbi:hypothetical protein CA267_005040 [Alteromonas pelagimontana]|uniref:Tyrosine specific protein phosphatases domain-containing protein n=1 Tax=Alteromonas pelagimontana TaxID=1858656 RepID=A0A6M4MAJ2_9ALTE|nr:dual specificity protein phosphatase family protein [Alteromonas pelagimontana]QJR80184.1 hypothetical protein CA267_005040 [Alteromonas pelagimontana]
MAHPPDIDYSESFSGFKIAGGSICLGTAPDAKRCVALRNAGFTHIATVQTSDESARTVQHAVQESGVTWIWLPFEHTIQCSESEQAHLQQYIVELQQTLQKAGSVYLHCDNSLRRCGLLFFALCHYLRLPSANAYSALHCFDAKSANGLPRQELEWAAALGSSLR